MLKRGVIAQSGSRPVEAHSALLEHVDVIRQRQRKLDALLGEQDSEALALEVTDALKR